MLFSSIVFIFYFLPIFLIFYWLTGVKNSILLTGSVVFYVWGEVEYIFLLIGLLIINHAAGILIEKSERRIKIIWLSLFVVINFGVLGVFKYSQFVIDVYASIFNVAPMKVAFHLPLGISFFIFQLVSYLVEVYRKAISAERNFVRLSTYVMMFPHLIAGPIVRYTDIVDELKKRTINIGMIGLGIQYFIVGLSQKVLIANTLAPVSDYAFSLSKADLNLLNSWIGVVAYSFQIYFDFCGYSNMAIGLALLLGFHFPKNFDYPYSSKSISEFWRRWHMSLSFWFRDYVYIPLGGSKFSTGKTVLNLAIVFLLTGLWHGAAWTFIFWGLFHGFFVILERLFLGNFFKRLPTIVSRIYTLLVVMVAWVFFRADTFEQSENYIKAMSGFGSALSNYNPVMALVTPEVVFVFISSAVFSFPVFPYLLERINAQRIPGPNLVGRTHIMSSDIHVIPKFILICGFVLSVALLASGSLNPFLYFRF